MTSLRKLIRTDGFNLEQLDDELLLYHPRETRAIYLNQTASLIWTLCEGRTIDEIVDLLKDGYPESAQELPTEVQAAVTQLLEAGALTEQ